MTTMVESMPAAGAQETGELLADARGRSWRGRRVTVVGLQRSGIAAARLLRRAGCRVRVTELHEHEAVQEARASLLAQDGIEAELGGHSRRFIDEAELLVVSPGVPDAALPLRWGRERGLPIISEVELAFHFCRAPIIAVTGTNGKSTTVTLITELLKSSRRSAVACGNLGIPFASVVSTLTEEMVAVVEVSSFQLLACHDFRPHISVLLNIGTNHLDRHPDQRAYLEAKARLFQRQTPEDWAVLNGADLSVAALGERCAARCLWIGDNRSNPPAFWLSPPTQASFTESAQAVLQVGRILGIPDPLAWQVLRGFRGLEHRLEWVATNPRGVHFINDSKSTTPGSLLFALSQVRGDVVVVLGGRDKGMDFLPLASALSHERVQGVVLIGESRARMRAAVAVPGVRAPIRECGTLEEAVGVAEALAEPGASVLFSPACASFDMFRDFEHRGRQFKAAVRARS